MLVLSNNLRDIVVKTTTNRYEGRNRLAYSWITGRLQLIAYIHIPQVCTTMHESHMRVFEHWRKINTPWISHFPMSYDEFIVLVLFKFAQYKNQQDEKQKIVQRLGDLATPRWRRLWPDLFPDDVRKTREDF